MRFIIVRPASTKVLITSNRLRKSQSFFIENINVIDVCYISTIINNANTEFSITITRIVVVINILSKRGRTSKITIKLILFKINRRGTIRHIAGGKIQCFACITGNTNLICTTNHTNFANRIFINYNGIIPSSTRRNDRPNIVICTSFQRNECPNDRNHTGKIF